MEKKEISTKDKSRKKTKSKHISTKTNYCTFEGHRLTVKEAKFIDLYMETGNQRQSVIEAGYKTKAPGQYGQTLLVKSYIKNEIDHRLQMLEDEKIASTQEILQFWTRVMRGEETDQFGLETTNADKIKASQELAKRTIDIANKVAGGKDTGEVKICLSFEGMEDKEESNNEEE